VVESSSSSHRGWFVVTIDGTTVAGPFMDKAIAERLASSFGPDHMVRPAAGRNDDAGPERR